MSADIETEASVDGLEAPAAAWLLPGRTLPVSMPTAAELRFARMEAWLGELGFHPIPFSAGRRGDACRITSGGWRYALRGLLLTPRLGYLALRERPRLVLTNAAVHAPAVALLKLLLRDRVFVVADVIGLLSLEIEQSTSARWLRSVYRPLWRLLESRLFASADLVLTVNDRHSRLVRERSPGANVHTLRDAADAELATVPTADRSELGIPKDGVAVAFLGSLVYSRLEPLFAAWEQLAQHGGPPLSLVVVGDGPDLRPYARRAADLGWLWRSVFFLGAQPHDEAIATLAACDIAYSECWSEAGFPAKLYEYMALEKPIVAENKSQLGEVLTDGLNACLFRTPEELSVLLRRLSGDPGLRARLGRHARETFLANHTYAARREQFGRLLAPVASDLPARVGSAPADGGIARTAGEPPPTRSKPRLISVVIPVLDAGDPLRRQLDAIEAQDHDGAWELVVADNGSTDGSVELATAWASSRSYARVVDASDREGPGHARNRGAAAAAGDFIVFCDADDVAEQGWLREMAEAATRTDLVGGRLSTGVLNTGMVRSWQESPSQLALLTGHGFLRFASGGSCGIWAEVFERLGGFDEEMGTGEDIDLSWRAQLAGHRLSFAPRAAMEISYQGDLRSLARQQYRHGISSGQLFRRFRKAGMPRPSPLHAAMTWLWLLASLPALLVSARLRGRWVATAALRCGRLAASVRYRVAFL